MNYTQLFETIKGYVENDFPNTQFTDPSAATATFTSKEQIDTFIQQAEERIFNSVQFPSLRKNVTAITSAYPSDPRAMYINAPGDFLAVYSLAVIDGSGNYEYLLNKDVNYLRAAYPIQQRRVFLSTTPCLGQPRQIQRPQLLRTSFPYFWLLLPMLFTTLNYTTFTTLSLSLLHLQLGLGITLILPYCTGHFARHTPT